MKKAIKITSGILACTLVLTNVNSLDITKANQSPSITVSSENENILAQIQNIEGKNYLVVKAIKDVSNIAVRVNVSNNQTFVFKHSELKKGELVHFELDIAEQKQVISSKKILPKTDIVREKLEVRGVVKGFNVKALVSYDVEKNSALELKNIESTKKLTDSVDLESKSNIEVKEDDNKNPEVINESSIADKAKKVEEAHSDAWENAAKNENKIAEKQHVVSSNKVENSVAAISKKVEIAQSDAWERASTVNNVTTPNLANIKTDEDKLIEELNKHRVDNGKQPLIVDNSLSDGTLIRANEFVVLANQGKKGMDLHLRLDGSKFNTVFPLAIRVKIGENVSFGTRLESLMKFWKNSPSHNNNMLSDKYKKVSIKVVKQNGIYYGVQIFSV